MNSLWNPWSEKPMSTSRAVIAATLLTGVLGAADGVIACSFKGFGAIQVLQYIAGGAIGSSAFQGGLSSAAIGAIFHIFIALVVATIYFAAASQLPILREWPVACAFYMGWRFTWS